MTYTKRLKGLSKKRITKDTQGVEKAGSMHSLYLSGLASQKEALKEAAIQLTIDKLEDLKLDHDFTGSMPGRFSTHLNDEEEEVARELFGKAIKDSFVLRHPWLTGIPTLGIAPMRASANAYSDAVKVLRKKFPKLRDRDDANKSAAHEYGVKLFAAQAVERRAREDAAFKMEALQQASSLGHRAVDSYNRKKRG
jgi:hypothetical protein